MCEWMGISHGAPKTVKGSSPQTKTQYTAKQPSHSSDKKDHSASPVPMINFTWMAMAFTAGVASFGALFLLVK